jgi:glutathione S-transferase
VTERIANLELVIGDKRLSSWSLRPWLAMTEAGLPFTETLVRLRSPEFAARVKSPSGRVPLLRHGDVVVWESLAIIEYVAELAPEARLWPADRGPRAMARALAAEMHAGFADLRKECPMDVLRADRTPPSLSGRAMADIERVQAAWREARARFGAPSGEGPFLFGRFGAVDAMFAPVATRLRCYAIPVDAEARAYIDAIYALDGMKRWIEGARAEAA